MNLKYLTIEAARELLDLKQITAVELVDYYIERIEKLNPELNAVLTPTFESARMAAKVSDERLSAGKTLSKLDGIPYLVKDVISTAGVRTTASSKILEDYIPPYSATVIELLNSAGAVMLGKTNNDEFAMGSSNESSYFGPVKNPWDKTRVPGGSSGGSAVAVSADLCVFSLGSDTGGSIRQPASLCSVTGFKPTYGRVSRYGLLAMASSLDQIGPFAKTAEDVETVLEIIAGNDELDSTSLPEKYQPEKETKKYRLGIPQEFFGEAMDGEVKSIVENAIKKLEEAGYETETVSLPSIDYALAAYYIIMPVEVSSNLARFDGIKYGYSPLKDPDSNIESLGDVYLKTREEGFGPEAKRRILLGSYTSSAGYYDAYYKKAQQVRSKVKADFDKAFEKVDLLVAPVSPIPAFKLGEKTASPLQMYLADVNTVPINPAGLPAISIPAGHTKAKLPVGLQIVGNRGCDNKVLNLAKIFQTIDQTHQLQPND